MALQLMVTHQHLARASGGGGGGGGGGEGSPRLAFTLERFKKNRAICYRFGCSFTLIQRKCAGKTITSEFGSQSGHFENDIMECRCFPHVKGKNGFKMVTYLGVMWLFHVEFDFSRQMCLQWQSSCSG